MILINESLPVWEPTGLADGLSRDIGKVPHGLMDM